MPRVDRTSLPAVGSDSVFSLPVFSRTKLTNGTHVWAAENQRAPIVTILLLLPVGAAADPTDSPGLAALTADLLDEGSANQSAVQIHEALMRIGGHLSAEVWSDATVLGLTTLSRHVREGLRLLFEITTQPRFDPDDVVRVRDLRLNRVRQMRRSPTFVADRVFLEKLYGTHPYGHLAIGTETALRKMDPAAVESFHRRWYKPTSWTLIGVGDVSPDKLLSEVSQVWDQAGVVASGQPNDVSACELRPIQDRMIFVDREDAVQSEIRLGQLSVPRSSPDYYALRMLNMVLGGQFVSRINLNLREEKGYTYGARTSFDWRVGRGPFSLQVSVQTEATVDSIRQAVQELTDIRGSRPPSVYELDLARAALTRGYPRSFETASQIAHAGVQLALHQLSDDDYTQFVPRIMLVDTDDVSRVAAQHLRPDSLLAVIVGSRSKVFEGLGSLGFGAPVDVTRATTFSEGN